jgi:xylulokinase
MSFLLGLDLATNGVTALVLQPGHPVVARTFEHYPTSFPRAGWVEQYPEDWWRAACIAIARVLAEAGIAGHDIKGIGLSGQMHGLVLVDEFGRPLRPALTWSDGRGQAQVDWMLTRASEREWMTWTATRPQVGSAGARLLWVRQEEPDLYRQIYKILAPKDFLRLRLTGEMATDVTDASSLLVFDVPARAWSREAIDLMELDEALLPTCYESQQVSGAVSIEASEVTGLAPGTPVIAGAGNQASAAMGLGVVRCSDVSLVLGSAGVVFATTDEPLIDRDALLQTCCHARRTKWYLVGMTQSAGIAFRWMRDTFCRAEQEVARQSWDDAYNLMARQADEVPCGSDGLIFLPYLQGERTPYQNPDARGVFYGVTLHHHKRHFIRAVMEGVAFGLRDCLQIVHHTGADIERIVVAGGGLLNPIWRQMTANVLGVPLARTNVADPAPFGAALMASVAAGLHASVEQACRESVQITETTAPCPEAMARYEEAYAIYRTLYPALQPSFAQTAAFMQGQDCTCPLLEV